MAAGLRNLMKEIVAKTITSLYNRNRILDAYNARNPPFKFKKSFLKVSRNVTKAGVTIEQLRSYNSILSHENGRYRGQPARFKFLMKNTRLLAFLSKVSRTVDIRVPLHVARKRDT